MTTAPPPALLPMPVLPRPGRSHDAAGPVGFTAGHHFSVVAGADPAALAQAAAAPLSVIVQVTKRCDFRCFLLGNVANGRPCAGAARRIPRQPGRRAAGVLVRWGAAAATGPA